MKQKVLLGSKASYREKYCSGVGILIAKSTETSLSYLCINLANNIEQTVRNTL